MSSGGLTEKRLRNKRFRRTEEAIFVAFFEGEEKLASMRQVAKRAGISKSTLYRHHRSLESIVLDYEEYMLRKYKATAKQMIIKKNVPIKMAVRQVVIFLLANKRVFAALLRSKKTEVIEKMVRLWEVRIKQEQGMSEECRKLLSVYAGEVVGVIEYWQETGFKEDEAGRVTRDIVYLTETIKYRLRMLI